MASIFLSYSHINRDCAKALAKTLETAGHDVWWDRRLDGGTEFSAEIEEALAKAEAVVVAWSKESVKSRWVRDEAAAGCEKNMLVPVSIDGSMPPMGFRQFHTLDLSGWKGARSDQRTADFLRTVERRLHGKESAVPSEAKATANSHIPLARGKRLWAAPGLLLLIAGIAIGLYLYMGREKPVGPAPKPTMALLAFTTASSDPELRQLASQARESIAHTFAQSGVPVRLMDSAPQGGPVDFLISGELSRNGDKVLATIRLDEAAHRITVFSDRFEATGEEVRNLPERIGAQMAGNLTWNGPLAVMDRRHPTDPAVLAEMLKGYDFTGDPSGLQSYQDAKRVAQKMPDLAMAQTGLAFATTFILADLPREERPEAVALARKAAERAIRLDPNFGDPFASWCGLQSETRLRDCEERVRAGRRIDPDAPFLNTILSHTLRAVGRLEEAVDLMRLSHSHDLYVPTKIAWMLRTHEYANEGKEARELYEQAVRWWPEYTPNFFRNRLYGMLGRGDFAAIHEMEKEFGLTNLPPNYTSTSALAAAVEAKSIPAARRSCQKTDDFFLTLRCMIALAVVGDHDGVYAITNKFYPRRVGRTLAETEKIWLDEPEAPGSEFITTPAAAPMRRDPRYLPLAQRIGLLDYWRSGRLPDFCRKQPEPICAQLARRR